jgi:hypothetical protein
LISNATEDGFLAKEKPREELFPLEIKEKSER